MYSRIAGTGSYLPEKVLTNFDLEKIVETTDEWIRTRTGIERRHVAAPEETTCDMAEQAARRAMESAGVGPEEIDLIVIGTTTPDQVFPNTGCLLQARLGIHGPPAIQLEAACSGFIYGLSIADRFIRTGGSKCALVIGADMLTRIVDWTDRTTCVLFADGAGAVEEVELADAAAEARFGDAQRAFGGGETRVLDHHREVVQVIQIVHGDLSISGTLGRI